jgi:hypothetical protein
MKTRGIQLIGSLLLGVLATACDAPGVDVKFTQPFPAGRASLAGFLQRDQGQYVAADDTSNTLVVGEKWLLSRRFFTHTLRAAQLDSLGLPCQAGWRQSITGHWYLVQQLAPNTFQLHWEERDTLASLLGPHRTLVRRYRGWYYLSTPVSRQWHVERLAIKKKQLCWQYFNPDSLRIRVLPPEAVHLARDGSWLLFALDPQPGQQSRQVSRYAGLWLTQGEYLHKE